jgi:Tryptophan-associated transmembrane protein (Trp_oprn_chp)
VPDGQGARPDPDAAGPAAVSGGRRARELTTVVVVMLGGGALALVVAQATWVHVAAGPAGPAAAGTAVALALDVPGSQAAPLVVPLAVLGLAGGLGLVATRRTARRLVGLLLVGCGAALAGAALAVPAGPRPAVAAALDHLSVDRAVAASASYQVAWLWPWLAALAGVAVLAGGLLAVLRAVRWPAMGARYDAPPGRRGAGAGPVDPWTALDRGDDPTLADGGTEDVAGAGGVPE